VEKNVEETKRIALGAKKRVDMPHTCDQKEAIDRTLAMVDSWSRWWRGTLISALGFVTVVGGSWLYQYFTLTAEVESTRISVEELSTSVKNIETSQEELKHAFQQNQDRDTVQDEARLTEVRSILKSVIQQELGTQRLVNRRRGN